MLLYSAGEHVLQRYWDLKFQPLSPEDGRKSCRDWSEDLVLIRGKGRLLPRMVYEQFGRVRCDKKRCTKTVLCDMCPELGAERELETCEPSW